MRRTLLILTFLLPTYGVAAQPIINELHYAPSPAVLEFIELFNPGSETYNLCTFLIADNRNQPVPLCESSVLLEPGQYAVLARDGELLIQEYPELASSLLISPSNWPALNNGGDGAQLFNNLTLVDAVFYESSWGKAGFSLERIDPAGPSQAAFNWAPCELREKASPGRQNSVYNPDLTAPLLHLAELTSPTSLSLLWTEHTDTTKQATFLADGASPIHINHLTARQTELTYAQPIQADQLRIENISDLTGNAHSFEHPIASLPALNDILITEVMFAPLANDTDHQPDQPEYVEAYNHSGKLLSLRHLALTGEPDEQNIADTLRSFLPYPVVWPNSYLILYTHPDSDVAIEHNLAAAFPDIRFTQPEVTLLPIDKSSLGLLNTADLVALSSTPPAVPKTQLDQVAYSSDWHHPLLAEMRGISLERYAIEAPTYLPSNWSSSVASSGGTPGAANSILLTSFQTLERKKALHLPLETFSPDGDGFEDVLPIHFLPEHPSQVFSIEIYNLSGHKIRHLVNASLASSEEIHFWDGTNNAGTLQPTGIYLVLLQVTDTSRGSTFSVKQPAVLARPFR